MTYATVSAHHQNGIAERKIRLVQDLTWSMLLDAAMRWPQAISPVLWLYAARLAQHWLNNTPSMTRPDRKTPLEAVAQAPINRDARSVPFRCPVYATEQAVAEGKPHQKWRPKSKIGIYLGPSPVHSRDTALVMDPATGLVSPEYHVKADWGFNTVTPSKMQMPWKFNAGVAPPPEPIKTDTKQQSGENERVRRKQRVDDRVTDDTNKRDNGRGWSPCPGTQRLERTMVRTVSREGDAPTVMEQFQTIAHTTTTVEDVLALRATTDPDTIYYHEPMKTQQETVPAGCPSGTRHTPC